MARGRYKQRPVEQPQPAMEEVAESILDEEESEELSFEPPSQDEEILAAEPELELEQEPEPEPELMFEPEPEPESDPENELTGEIPIPMPSKEELLSAGYEPSIAQAIMDHMAELPGKIEAAKARLGRKFVMRPALRILAMRTGGFWLCGRKVAAGSPWEPLIEDLSEAQLREIETARGKFVGVEEIEVEAELESGNAE